MTGPTQHQVRTVAVTGAAGSLAADVMPGLEEAFDIVGIDTRPRPEGLTCRWVQSSVTDRDALRRGLQDVDAVVHLAGIPLEDEWDRLLAVNVDGTQAVLEAARLQGVRRVVLASSIHAAGFTPVPQAPGRVPDEVPIRPNTFYGVTKAAVEALGSLYRHRHAMDVVTLRIASRFPRPMDERMLSTWLSPADALRLLNAALTAPTPLPELVWGVSANARSYLSPLGGAALGFHPEDNAEAYAAELIGAAGPGAIASDWDRQFIGGVFCSPHPPSMDTLTTDGRSDE